LYMPPGEQKNLRADHPMMSPFGPEFGLPQITAGKLASEEPTDGLQPR